MKTISKAFTVIILMLITSAFFAGKSSAQQGYVSFQVFYDQLSPYGDWVNSPEYDYVWIPDAGPDFSPYSTEGRWILTEYGWTWLSYYDWGWAPFHYGRWDFNNYYGWFWIPDIEWGPAWVSWRRADGYFGWEPMQPGISISMSFGRQNNYHSEHWIFVRERDFNRPDIDRYYVSRRQNDRIIRSSTVINNTYSDSRRNTTYVTGPAREDILRATGRNIRPVAIQEYDKPGHDVKSDHVSLYMPGIRKNNNNDQRSSPSRITQRQDIKKPSERRTSSKPSPDQVNQISNKTLQPQTTAPQQNNAREQQQNIRIEQQQRNVQGEQQQNTQREQQQSIRREQQQNTQREQQQNVQREQQQNAQREQQQKVRSEQQENAKQQQDTRREQQQNTTRQQESKKEQQQNVNRRQTIEKKRQNNVEQPKTQKRESVRKSGEKKEIKENT